jgi:uncharacterized protein (TIGR01244 family)
MRGMLKTPIVLVAALLVSPVYAQVSTETVPGVTNFARVETTVACAGATKPEALAQIKQMGFKSVINLRLPSEAGAELDAEAAAAQAAGIKYVHLPFDTANPDAAVVDKFLAVIADPATQPAFIHCASGNRAAAFWFIKRVLVDRWTAERAMQEAGQLGLKNEALKTFAIEYVKTHKT